MAKNSNLIADVNENPPDESLILTELRENTFWYFIDISGKWTWTLNHKPVLEKFKLIYKSLFVPVYDNANPCILCKAIEPGIIGKKRNALIKIHWPLSNSLYLAPFNVITLIITFPYRCFINKYKYGLNYLLIELSVPPIAVGSEKETRVY